MSVKFSKLIAQKRKPIRRSYTILLFRYLLAKYAFFIFFRYDGDSSKEINELRYHLLNHNSHTLLLHSSILSGVFNVNNNTMLNSRVLLVYSDFPRKLLTALENPRYFSCVSFITFNYEGLFCQQPIFEELKNFSNVNFLHFYILLSNRLLFIVITLLQSLLALIRLLNFTVKDQIF